MKLEVILWGIPQAMRACALVYPKFRERLKERDAIAQFALKEEPAKGRWIQLKGRPDFDRRGYPCQADFYDFLQEPENRC